MHLAHCQMHRKEVTQNATPHFEQLVQQTSEIAAKFAASNAGRRLMNRANDRFPTFEVTLELLM